MIQFTCREAEQIPKPIRSILDSAISKVTSITLAPLTEEEVVDYVASTLSRPRKEVQALAVVCLEKTNGCVKSMASAADQALIGSTV